MKDIIQQAVLDTPQKAIEALTWPKLSYMYLETIVNNWLPLDSRQSPCLTTLDVKQNFSEWERGRVFCPEFELRWEKQRDKFQLVYVGTAVNLPNFSLAEIDLPITQRDPISYYLWGRRVAQGDLQKIGLQSEPPGIGLFIEMRVAQRLQYPIQNNDTQRVKLNVYHYSDKTTGQVVYHRYYGLEEVTA